MRTVSLMGSSWAELLPSALLGGKISKEPDQGLCAQGQVRQMLRNGGSAPLVIEASVACEDMGLLLAEGHAYLQGPTTQARNSLNCYKQSTACHQTVRALLR